MYLITGIAFVLRGRVVIKCANLKREYKKTRLDEEN